MSFCNFSITIFCEIEPIHHKTMNLHIFVWYCTVSLSNVWLFYFSFPRYMNEVICHSTDKHCLLGQGACVQSYSFVTFKRNLGGYSISQLHLWTDYQQMVRNGCHCQLIKGSAFDPFIWFVHLMVNSVYKICSLQNSL